METMETLMCAAPPLQRYPTICLMETSSNSSNKTMCQRLHRYPSRLQRQLRRLRQRLLHPRFQLDPVRTSTPFPRLKPATVWNPTAGALANLIPTVLDSLFAVLMAASTPVTLVTEVRR